MSFLYNIVDEHPFSDKNAPYLIYVIINKINGKKYIGSTTRGIKQRWKEHKKDARKKQIMSISKAIAKYGHDNFDIKVIMECWNLDHMNSYEKFFIKEFDSMNYEKGYNRHIGGENKGSLIVDKNE